MDTSCCLLGVKISLTHLLIVHIIPKAVVDVQEQLG